jgi:hypothetical protein
MKTELSFLERGYQANLCRRRAAELRALAEKKSMSALRQELLGEADYVDDMAKRYDEGADQELLPAPRIASPRADIDAVDRPTPSTNT